MPMYVAISENTKSVIILGIQVTAKVGAVDVESPIRMSNCPSFACMIVAVLSVVVDLTAKLTPHTGSE